MKTIQFLSLLTVSLFIISCNNYSKSVNSSSNKTVSRNILDFIPNDAKLLDSASGDLNSDGVTDILLVLESSNKPHNPTTRPAIILTSDSDSSLRQIAFCKNAAEHYAIWEGDDPFQGVIISNGYFTLEHHLIQKNLRWTYNTTFKYDSLNNKWYLHKIGMQAYNLNDPNDSIKSYVVDTSRFGVVWLEEFNTERARYFIFKDFENSILNTTFK